MAKSSDRSGGLRQSLSPLGHLYNRPAHAQNNDDLRRAVAKLSVSSVLDGSPISVRPVAAATRSRYEGSRSTYSRQSFNLLTVSEHSGRYDRFARHLAENDTGFTQATCRGHEHPCPDTAASIHFWANTTADMK